jgi:RimJ/RimL family protein N-acetyltransferase
MVFLKIPGRIKGNSVTLRRLRIFDGPFLKRALKDEDILKSIGSSPRLKSWFSLWWWFERTYCYPYCIEVNYRRIGFIGLYNPLSDKSIELSLVIFHKEDRRHGYGTSAFSMLKQKLQQSHFFKKIIVRVKEDNYPSTVFWKNLGFKEIESKDGFIAIAFTIHDLQ